MGGRALLPTCIDQSLSKRTPKNQQKKGIVTIDHDHVVVVVISLIVICSSKRLSIGGDTIDGDDDIACESTAPPAGISVLAKVDALPRSQREATVRDGDVE